DHRCQWARRLRDLIADHTSDLGGPGAISQAEKLLIRRAAMLALQLELQEQRFALNEDGLAGSKAIETYQRCTNTLRRTLEYLGPQRRQRDVSPPTLEQYQRRLEAPMPPSCQIAALWTQNRPRGCPSYPRPLQPSHNWP